MDRAYDHSEFREHIDAFLAGGLDAAERAAFEAHAASCASCAAMLSEAASQDASLRELFDAAHPPADFEDRLVRRLRSAPAPGPFLHPMVRRAATGVAAAVLLGGFGYVASNAVRSGGMPTPWARFGGTPARQTVTFDDVSALPQFVDRFTDQPANHTVRAIETPADMARRFNTQLSDSDGDTKAWFYKERAGERAESRGRWDERLLNWQSQSRTAPADPQALGFAAPGMMPGMAGMPGGGTTAAPPSATPAPAAAENREKLADERKASKQTGATNAPDTNAPNADAPKAGAPISGAAPRGDDFAPGQVQYRYGANANAGIVVGSGAGGPASTRGGFGGGGGAQDARGFGMGGPGIGAGGAGPAGGAGLGSVAARPADNGRTPDAAKFGNRYDPSFNVQLGLEADFKSALADGRSAGGKDVAGKPGGFKPTQYFDAAAPAEGAAVVDATRHLEDSISDKEIRDAQPAEPAGEGEVSLESRVVRLKQQESAQESAESLAGDTATEAAPAPASAAPAAPPQSAPVENPTAGRKIIRNGEMTFEVDGFDSAYVQITKIAQEEGGFVATTDSEKLANGKVKGTVTIRVPPDRLDTLVLKLRGLGDLKSSKLAANDITKQYTDLESQLRASRAMEERLLNIIKTGKGEIKDLVEAEKQLGVYREKIEMVEGEIRYYNNLVSLSTLNVTMVERDIRTAAMLSETEQVNMGVESPDVEKSRADAIKAIEEAKGRIVESDLKKLEAGQFAGKVVADVPPDAAGPLIDRMKQIGTVARLEVTRKQTAPEGTVAPTPARGAAAPRLERRDTRFIISLYNLANVAPRQTTNLNLAAEDVEAAYRTILDQVKGAGGRIVTSQLNRPRPDQTTGTITFEAPTEGADVLLGAVRAVGEVMRLEVSQNPDAQNVTEAKRGFAVQVFSIASVAPRETTTLRLAVRGVSDAFNRLREAVRAAEGARILSSQLTEQDPANVTGTLDFEVRRADWATVETALGAAGQVVSRNVTRSADVENTVDTKVRLQVVLADEASLQPRESVTMQLAVADVPGRYGKLLEALAASQARILQSQLSEQEAQNSVTGTLVFDVRRENLPAIDRAVSEAGDRVSRSVVRSTDAQNTLDDKVRLSLTLVDAAKLPPRETTTLGMESSDVEKAKEQIEALALSLGGRVVDSTLSREQNGRVIGKVVADVPLGRSLEMVRKTRDQGRVQFRRDARDDSVPQGTLARARVDVTIANEDLIVESGQGLWATVRDGLRTSVTGLLWSLQLIVVGLFLVAPWVLILYVGWRLLRRGKTRKQATTAVPAT